MNEEATKARDSAVVFVAERARDWSPWAPVYQFGVEFCGFVFSISA